MVSQRGVEYAARLAEQGVPPSIITLLISTLPVVELRGALPVGINYLGLPWPEALGAALIGNLLPVMPILLFLDGVVRVLGRIRIFRNFFDWLFARTTRRHSRLIERYKFLGLVILVAIPLPLTGAWTGALVAFLMGIPPLKAFLAIGIGVLIAGGVVTALCELGVLGAVIAGIGLSAVAISSLWRWLRRG